MMVRSVVALLSLCAACDPPAIAFRPAPGTSWQWQLAGLPIDTSFEVDVYDVDLFDVPADDIAALKGAGRAVICYVSAGTFEPFRDDADRFPPEVIGNEYEEVEFADERYLDVRAGAVRDIMRARFDLARDKGCDAVEPDNVDLHEVDTGFDITPEENLAFNRFLASEAHARGLSIGLKNNLSQLGDLAGDFEWALNESCFSFVECDVYLDNFLAADKAVFHAEYVDFGLAADVCAVTEPLGISSILKNLDLDAAVAFCP